ncbi:MAG: hypothetical protein PHV93_03080 [Candidatus Pacebacteria bacterium]|nr:hypothetical protein [Candidatus Paceibacterota bacterium]
MNIRKIDLKILHFLRKISIPLARFSIFLVFFWFGALKVLGLSPASVMVKTLLHSTMPFMDPPTFLIFFGLFEMLIGILFLIPGLERVVIPLLFIHMITTVLPLFILPKMVWTSVLVPTLEGQYIIKNIAIIAAAIGIAAHLHPIRTR